MKSEPRRAYAPPAVLSQSQFERRGILQSCCQTGGNCSVNEGGEFCVNEKTVAFSEVQAVNSTT